MPGCVGSWKMADMPASSILADPAWRPSPRAKLLWALENSLGIGLLLIALVVWVLLDGTHRGWQLGAGLVLLVLAIVAIGVVPLWRYAVHRWEVTEDAVYSRIGWFDQESRVAPISRVQTVDTERGPIEQLLGLATVTVTTASSAGAVKISALDRAVAEQTVTRLAAVAAQHRGDAT